METLCSKQHLITEKRKFFPSLESGVYSGYTEGVPSLDYRLAGNLGITSTHYNFWGWETTLNLPIFSHGSFFGLNSSTVKIAKLQKKISELSFFLSKNEKIENLANLYGQIISIYKNIKYQELYLELQKIYYKKNHDLFQQKRISQKEWIQTKLKMQNTYWILTQLKISLENNLKIAQLLLGSKTMPKPEEFCLPSFKPLPTLEFFLQHLNTTNFSILRGRLNKELAFENYELAKKDLLPILDLLIGHRYYSTFKQDAEENFLIFSFNFKFGFDNFSVTKEKLLSIKRAEENFKNTILSVKQSLISTFYEYKKLYYQLKELQNSLKIEKLNLEELKEKFKLGEITKEELLSQKLLVASYDNQIVSLKVQLFLKYITLKHFLGLKWNEPWTAAHR